MRELAYEDWSKNTTPRMMWVWDSNESNKQQRKVIYFLGPKLTFPVVALSDDEISTENFKHCAEIEEIRTRRMTKKELSRWLREKPTREYKNSDYISRTVYSSFTYAEDCGDEEVAGNVLIREDDGEWQEPLIEVTDD